jgi:hypothetical protein
LKKRLVSKPRYAELYLIIIKKLITRTEDSGCCRMIYPFLIQWGSRSPVILFCPGSTSPCEIFHCTYPQGTRQAVSEAYSAVKVGIRQTDHILRAFLVGTVDRKLALIRQYAGGVVLTSAADWRRYCTYYMTLSLILTTNLGWTETNKVNNGSQFSAPYEPQHWRHQRLHGWPGTVYTTDGIYSTGYTMYHIKSRGKLLYCTVQYMNGSGHNRFRPPLHPYDASTPVMCCRMLHLCW